jgi:tetratricopeptide (TPR) repeat protein
MQGKGPVAGRLARMRLGVKGWTVLILSLGAGYPMYRTGLYAWGAHYRAAAESDLERRDFAAADLHFRQCLQVWPDDLGLRLQAAQTARRHGDWDKAFEQLQVYEKKHGPAEPLALEYRLWAVQQGDLTLAPSLWALCQANPDPIPTRLILEALIQGSLNSQTAAYIQGMYIADRAWVEQTQQAVELWLKLSPGGADHVQGLVWRGRTYALADAVPKAIADLRKALELDANHLEARLHLGMLLAPNDPAAAARELAIVRGHDPTDDKVRLALASVRRRLGQLEEARDILDGLLASNPNDLSALLERGRVALDMQQPDVAEGHLRRALELAPGHPHVHLALSTCLQMAGKVEEAREHRAMYLRFEAANLRNKPPGE